MSDESALTPPHTSLFIQLTQHATYAVHYPHFVKKEGDDLGYFGCVRVVTPAAVFHLQLLYHFLKFYECVSPHVGQMLDAWKSAVGARSQSAHYFLYHIM